MTHYSKLVCSQICQSAKGRLTYTGLVSGGSAVYISHLPCIRTKAEKSYLGNGRGKEGKAGK